jgi:hypothetical protein
LVRARIIFPRRVISKVRPLVFFGRHAATIVRSQIFLVRSHSALLRRASVFDRRVNSLVGHAASVCGRVIVVGRRDASWLRHARDRGTPPAFFDVRTIRRAGARSFSDGAAKGFAVAIRISVAAPILSVLASIFLVPTPSRSHQELSAEIGVQRL